MYLYDIFTKKPTDGLFGVTYKCNSRCITCNIWKLNTKAELPEEFFKKLPGSLRNICLTGGEPFLHSQILNIFKTIIEKYPKADFILSTNGLILKPRFINVLKKDRKLFEIINKKLGIGISLDGPEEINDKIRGVKNNYKIVMETIESLKEMGYKDIRISLTISKDNVKYIKEIYDYCKEMKINFTAGIVHNSDNYFNIKTNKFKSLDELKKQLNYVVSEELKTFVPKKWFMAYFINGLYYIMKYNKRPIKCHAVRNAFYVDPDGDVYPCIFRSEKIGNINKRDIKDILKNPDVPDILEKVKNCQIPCWQMCTARISILKYIYITGFWVIINKIKAHLNIKIM